MSPLTVLLGTAQDAGFPHVGCRNACCERAWSDPSRHRLPCCLGIVDPDSQQRWMIDCTPEFPRQLRRLDERFPIESAGPPLDGILLTHAHIGHYTGLISLGTEALAAAEQRVFVMPRMQQFLQENAPWNRLIAEGHVVLQPMTNGRELALNERISVTPLLVPHRDEFSETVAFILRGPDRSLLYLPDIDAWDHWETPVEQIVAKVDVAYLDGSFYDRSELPGRNHAEIPHPCLIESLSRFRDLAADERRKIRFFHFNHTNPALDPESAAAATVTAAGFRIAMENERESL